MGIIRFVTDVRNAMIDFVVTALTVITVIFTLFAPMQARYEIFGTFISTPLMSLCVISILCLINILLILHFGWRANHATPHIQGAIKSKVGYLYLSAVILATLGVYIDQLSNVFLWYTDTLLSIGVLVALTGIVVMFLIKVYPDFFVNNFIAVDDTLVKNRLIWAAIAAVFATLAWGWRGLLSLNLLQVVYDAYTFAGLVIGVLMLKSSYYRLFAKGLQAQAILDDKLSKQYTQAVAVGNDGTVKSKSINRPLLIRVILLLVSFFFVPFLGMLAIPYYGYRYFTHWIKTPS